MLVFNKNHILRQPIPKTPKTPKVLKTLTFVKAPYVCSCARPAAEKLEARWVSRSLKRTCPKYFSEELNIA